MKPDEINLIHSERSPNRDNERLVEALAEYRAACDAGKPLNRQCLLKKYSDVAEQLAECLNALSLVNEATPPIGLLEQGVLAHEGEHGGETILGDFRILREIGRGGMGVVYEAEQISLPRRVAIKVLPFAVTMDSRRLERFKNEARTAATLDHPGIVSIYAVGYERGVHFFAMQYVERQSLAEIITQLKHSEKNGKFDPSGAYSELLTLTEGSHPEGNDSATLLDRKDTVDQAADDTNAMSRRNALVNGRPGCSVDPSDSKKFFRFVATFGAQAAEALDHAHSRGVVHRDVKPANLMLDADRTAKVADFGLARIEEDAGMTMTGDILGTLRYMSPEQALAKRAIVDHRTDIYSLGTTLYELVTLQPMFDETDSSALLRKIAFDEPVAPRRRNKAIPSELEIVILKAISKDPNDRYQTAQDLADDLARWLDGLPITARPMGTIFRIYRWARRRPVTAALTLLLIFMSALCAVGGWVYSQRLRVALNQTEGLRAAAVEQRDQMEVVRDRAQRLLYASRMRMANEALDDGGIASAETILDLYRKGDYENQRDFVWGQLNRRIRDVASATLQPRSVGSQHDVYDLRYSADGHCILGGSQDGCVTVWDATTGNRIRELREHNSCVNTIAVASNGKLVGTASCDGTVKVWSWPELELLQTLDAHQAPVRCVAFSPSGADVVSGGDDGRVLIWDTESGDCLGPIARHDPEVESVAFSPDGRQIASTGLDGTLQLVDRESLELAAQIRLPAPAHVVEYRSDGEQIFVGHNSGYTLCPATDLSDMTHSVDPPGDVRDAMWASHASTLAVGYGVGNVVLKDNRDRSSEFNLHAPRLLSLCLSPDGTRVVTSASDNGVRSWNVTRLVAGPSDSARNQMDFDPITRVAFASSTGDVVTVGPAGQVKLHPLRASGGSPRSVHNFSSVSPTNLRTSSDASVVVTNNQQERKYSVWQLDPNRQTAVHQRTSPGEVVCISPKGRLLVEAVVEEDPSPLRLVETDTGAVFASLGVHSRGIFRAAFSRDGRVLAVVTNFSTELWKQDQAGSFSRLTGLAAIGRPPISLSGNGQRVAIAMPEGVIVFAAESVVQSRGSDNMYTAMRPLAHTEGLIVAISLTSDGQTLAVATQEETTVWDVEGGEKLLTLAYASPAEDIRNVAFCNNDNMLVAWRSGEDDTARPARLLWWKTVD